MEQNTCKKDNEPVRNNNFNWAVSAGIIDGGDPHAFVTREETAVMIRQALDYFFQQIILVLQERD